jgi:hypothetical protein
MKMFTAGLIVLVSALSAWAQPSEIRNWKTVFGANVTAWLQCYTNDTVTLQKVGITYTYKFSVLSPADQQYVKPRAGIVFSAPEEDQKIKEQQRQKMEQEQREKELLKSSFHFKGRVSQIINDGILFDGGFRSYEAQQEVKRKSAEINEIRKKISENPSDLDMAIKLYEKAKDISETIPPYCEGIYLIVGIPHGLVDNDEWTGTVYAAGQYQYTSLVGVTKTIRAFATTPEKAFKLSLQSSPTPELQK